MSDVTKCFVYSKDLMFSSQVTNAAKSAGFAPQTIFGVEQLSEGEQSLVVLDLTNPQMSIDTTVARLKSLGAVVLAVGPHVHEAKLKLAQSAGADAVLTKGQASRELADVLTALRKETE